MSVAEHTRVHVALPHPGIMPLIAVALRRFAQWRVERNAIRQLSHFSDAMLKDMGVTRGEIPGQVRHGRSETHKHHRD